MENENRKKKIGAILAAALVIVYFGAMLITIIWACTVDRPSIGILVLIFGCLGVPIVGVSVALFLRLKEIDGGEENEACKY